MRDLRQTRNYVIYLKLIGWKVGSVNNVYYFSKEIPVIGSVIKIQRPENIISVFSINEIVKQKRAFMVIIEPLNQLQFDYYSKEWGFKAVKSPSLPSKTIHIDLTKNEKQLLSQMHNKARYNIGLSKRRGVIVKKSNDIKLFSDFWTECAKKRNLFLSLK